MSAELRPGDPAGDPSGAPPAAPPRYYLGTWGCQMNVHDSEKISGLLEGLGYVRAESPAGADLVLLNTCAVREKAAEKVYDELGRLRRHKASRPGMLIAVGGCVGSMQGETVFDRAPHVDVVLGPRGVMNLPALLEAARAKRRAIDVAHHQESVLFPWQQALRAGGPHAYVTVVEGCNKACSFCIVPVTRGRETSRLMEDVLDEARSLLERGYREIEYLGQTVNAYRDPRGRSLADLLRATGRIEGLCRLRFTTSHPLHMTDDLMRAMAETPPLVRHLHLPVQSGSDGVLRRMRRGYTRAGYLDRVGRLRALVPDVTFSTDIIVGFPGETEEDFRATLGLVEEVGFDAVYSFLYSPRAGTESAGWEEDTPLEIRSERLARLQARQDAIQRQRLAAWVGREVEVLVEGPAKHGEGILTGRTFHGLIANFPAAGSGRGDLVRVQVERAGAHSLKGRIIRGFS